jgi:hypothetical protein
MLTGSVAMAYYATPGMTRDIDIVVALAAKHVSVLEKAFATDFYIDLGSVREAIVSSENLILTADCDMGYVQKWASVLGVSELLKDLQ